MRLSDSKYDNVSTSGSDYFKQRFAGYQPQVERPSQSKIYKPEMFSPSVSKVISEYEMATPTQYLNRNHDPLIHKHESPSHKLFKNPFSSPDYTRQSTGRQDRSSENRLESKNSHIESFNYPKDSIQKPNRLTGYSNSKKLFQTKNNIENASESEGQYYRRNSFKENVKTTETGGKYNKKARESYDRIQPVTMLKKSPSQGILRSVQFNPYIEPVNESSLCPEQPIPQPHILLQHIHCTIAHESSILQAFKLFVREQKQLVQQRFSHIKREIQNTLDQVKAQLCGQIDQSYQLVIRQMRELKSRAELMWQHKDRKNSNSIFKNSTIYGNEHTRPSRSSSAYKTFSQIDTRSPQTNNNLLIQLQQEDLRLQQYKQTHRAYFNNNYLQSQQIDRNKLLTAMYQNSLQVSRMVKQCDHKLYELINADKINKKRLFSWVHHNDMMMDKSNGNIREPGPSYFFDLRQYLNQQISSLTKDATSLRQIISNKSYHRQASS